MHDLMLVDDEPGILAALSVRLKAEGITVRSATNGEQALELAAQRSPDVAVLDIRMPGMDGIELCKRLKSNQRTASVPVLFLSAETSEATREAALNAGGAGFLNKPYDAIELLGVIQKTLETTRGEKHDDRAE